MQFSKPFVTNQYYYRFSLQPCVLWWEITRTVLLWSFYTKQQRLILLKIKISKTHKILFIHCVIFWCVQTLQVKFIYVVIVRCKTEIAFMHQQLTTFEWLRHCATFFPIFKWIITKPSLQTQGFRYILRTLNLLYTCF